MKMTHKHDVYFSPHSTEAHSLVMQIADYCNKRGIWYKISESTLGIGIVYGGNVGYVIDADRKTEPTTEDCSTVDKDINVRSKDEPQTEREIAKAIVHKMIDDAVIAEDAYPDLRQKMHDAVDEYEPQTDCDGCQHYADKQTADACYECKRSYTDGYVPQTERIE